MHTNRRWFFTFLAGATLVIVALAWIFFAPHPLGGQASYVMITGNSMEPVYHTGDLVIVRNADLYSVGDIVTYWDPLLGRYVIHRIISQTLDRFILKGDHNTWFDSYQPTTQEIIGKAWLYLPSVGKFVVWIRNPWIITLVIGSTVAIVMAVLLTRSKNKKKRKHNSLSNGFTPVKQWLFGHLQPKEGKQVKSEKNMARPSYSIVLPPPVPSGGNQPLERKSKKISGTIEALFFTLGLLALASLVLGIFSFANPVFRNAPDDIQYQQTGLFTYTGVAPDGVYDSGQINSGEPFFPKLTCGMVLMFDYQVTAPLLQDITGTHQLTALIIENQSKWQRAIPLESKVPFTGNSFSSTVNINLCDIESLAAAFETQTDLHPSFYSLQINPTVEVGGKVSNLPLADTFQKSLTFQFDKVQFFLVTPDPQSDPLKPVQIGLIKNILVEPNTLNILGLQLPVLTGRLVSLLGLIISIAGIILLLSYISKAIEHDEEALVRIKYGSMLVDVQEHSLASSNPAVDVLSMDDLVKMAEKNNSVILHESQGTIHNYFLQDNQITYRFSIGNGKNQNFVPGRSQISDDLRQGIERGEFKVYYQPIVSLIDGKITGIEALLRWQRPQSGLTTAQEFILACEATGLIDVIGEWMLQVACAQFKEWRLKDPNLTLAVNFSKRQLEGDPVKLITHALLNSGLHPESLQIDVPESYVTQDTSAILPTLHKLQNLGIRMSLDHYSGSSTISSLQQLPFSSVKIDRHIIEDINNENTVEKLKTLIANARHYGINIIAEGVETEDQLNFLRSHAINQAQGYLLGRPMPAQEISAVLQEKKGISSNGILGRFVGS